MSGNTRNRSVLRVEDAALLTGRCRFVDDIQLPHTLKAAFLRSAHAHAAIRGIDVKRALECEGVHAVYTLTDLRPQLTNERLVVALPSKSFKQQLDRPVLASREAVYVGEAMAVVVADSRRLAEDALAAIEVDYEPLPAVVDCRDGAARNAPKAHALSPHNVVAEFDLKFGDPEAAFSRAGHVFTESLRQTRGGSHSIECRGNLADYNPATGQITLWSSTQTPHAAMRLIAELLGRDEGTVRVIAPEVGGGFGPKLVFYQEDIVTVLAAILLQRPVKWIEDRREHFVSTTQERDQYWEISIAVEADGRVRGVRGAMLHDHGAYTARGINVAFEAAQTLTMAYDVPACDLNVKLIATNKVPVTPVRGAGQPQGVFAMERLLDRVARELTLDRAELRRRNLIRPEQIPHSKPFATRSGIPVVIDTGDYLQSQAKAMAAAGWDQFPNKQQSARQEGRYLGIGLANFVELTGRGPYEPATVKINTSGKIHVSSSAAAMGQGTKTMLAQIVAKQLGGDMTNVVVITGDTASSLTGFGGFGSRQTVTAGSSAHAAATMVREKTLAVASHLLEASADDLEIEGTEVRVKGAHDVKVTLAEIARASVGTAGVRLPGDLPPGLEATEKLIINEMAYSNGTAVVTVEVDIETGCVVVQDVVVAHDCGHAINPAMVEGQVLGGFVHGLGSALFERMVFDADGQPLTTTLADYLIPTSTEIPPMRLLHLESPTTLNPLGVKGVGEAGVIPAAAAIASAIDDALGTFSVSITHTPVAPGDIVALIAAARAVKSV
ncbi:MAG: xanthine dehydrogenase family protein molybdopterin-binding subunit [Xanthobacteraceae bacterium]